MKDCSCGKKIKNINSNCLECHTKIRANINRSKKDLKEGTDNWWMSRIPIAKHARRLYAKSDQPKQCAVCGYDKHYQVCHIKAVSEFSEESTIEEINNLNNLVALCPNHHWEFDKGLIEL